MMDNSILYFALTEMYQQGHIEDAPRSYSGRGMFGANCIGVDLADHSEIFKVGALLGSLLAGQDEFDVRELSRSATDSMGRGVILYWPGLSWEDEFEERGE